MEKKIIKAAVFIIILICLFIIGMYTSIELVAYDNHFYEQQYIKYGIHYTTELTNQQLMDITGEMQKFLKGKRADFDIYAVINGNNQPVFNEQEQQHMLDVQKLFIRFKIIRNICLILLILIIAKFYKKQKIMILKILRNASILNLCFLLALGIGVIFFFDPLFNGFHELLFTNELWLFDPETSVLVNMLPQEFFIACATRIVIYNLIYYAGIITFAVWGKNRNLRGHHER